MKTLPLAFTTLELLAAGYRTLGKIQSPECTTHYFAHPGECRIAVISETKGPLKCRAYDAPPLEILSIATLCLEHQQKSRAEAVRLAHIQLSLWGMHVDHVAHATKSETRAAGSLY